MFHRDVVSVRLLMNRIVGLTMNLRSADIFRNSIVLRCCEQGD